MAGRASSNITGCEVGQVGARRDLDPKGNLELDPGREDGPRVLQTLRHDGAALRHTAGLTRQRQNPVENLLNLS